MVKRLQIVCVAVAATLLVSPRFVANESASAHPLHTSLAELVVDQKTGAVQLSLRVFVDDFTKAAIAFQQKQKSVRPPSTALQSPLVLYATAGFALTDSRGRRVAFTSCGGKRVGDLMWLCFRGQMTPATGGFRVASQVMFDTFRDQINIVQATYGSRKVNLLFTPGEGAKPVS